MKRKNTTRFLKQNVLWILFFGFAFFAICSREDTFIFASQSPFAIGKYMSWVIFFCFLTYSIYASSKENFFKTLIGVHKMLWGRQIVIDLYIGLLLPLLIVFLHGGTFVFLVWLIPILIYANMATLLYLALNYDSLVSYFMV